MSDIENYDNEASDANVLRYSRVMLVALSRSPLVSVPEGMPSVESYMTKPEPRDERDSSKPKGDKILFAPAKQNFPSSQVSTGPREDEPTTPGSKPPSHRNLTSPAGRKVDGERDGSAARPPLSAGRGTGALPASRTGSATSGSVRRENDKDGMSVPRVNGARLIDRPGQGRTGSTGTTSSTGTGTTGWASARVPAPTTTADGITKLGSIKVLSTTTTPKAISGSRNTNWRGDDGESGRDKLSRSAPDRDNNDRRRGKDNTPEWMNDDLASPKDGTRPTEDLFQQFKAKLKELERDKNDKSEKSEKQSSAPNEKGGSTTKVSEKKQPRTAQPKEGGKSPTKPAEGSNVQTATESSKPTAVPDMSSKPDVSSPSISTPESERSSVAVNADRTSGGGRGSRFQRFFGGEDGEGTPSENVLPTVRGVYEGGPTSTPLQPVRQVVTSPGQPLTEQELLASLVGNSKTGSPPAAGPGPANVMPHPSHGQSIDILALLGSGPARPTGGEQPGLGDRNLRGSAPASSQHMLSEEEVLRRLTANPSARKTPKMSEMPIDRSPPIEERQEMDRIMAMLTKNNSGPTFANELPPGIGMGGRDPNRGSFSQFSMQQSIPNPMYSPPPSSAQMPPQLTPNRMRFPNEPPYPQQMKGMPPAGLNGSGMPMPPKNMRQGQREPLFSSHIPRQQQFDDPLAAMVQNSINAKKSHMQGLPMGPSAGDIQNMIKQGLLSPAELQNTGLMFPPPGSLDHRFEPNAPGGLPPLSGLPPNHHMLSNDPVAFAAFAAAASQGMPGGGGLPPNMMQHGPPPPGFFGNGMPPPPNMGMGPPPPGFFNPSMFGMPPNQAGGPPPHLFGGRGGR